MTSITHANSTERPADDQSIVALSTIARSATFSDLVAQAGGRHPTELLEFLRRLDRLDPSQQRHVESLIAHATRIVAGTRHPQGDGLALPHPMDCEWRFTDETADFLLAAASDATKPGDAILLMGVPSVVVAAHRSAHDRHFLVVGETNIISDQLRNLTAADSRFEHHSLQASFAAAILDPPWYPDQFCSMLAEAASGCGIGAHIFLSAPSASVRPSIPEDLRKIGAVAVHCGLDVADHRRDKLKYRTPFFEINALRAAGVGAWLPEWRRGDLRVYRKSSNGNAWSCQLPERSGFEVTLAGTRLRLLDLVSNRATLDLVPIHSGEIFPSVSMRAPRRSEGILWTSGNRAFSVDRPSCLRALLAIAMTRQLLPKGLFAEISSTMKPEPIDRINPLIQKLLDLVDREFAEAKNVLGSDAWETGANDARFLSASQKGFP